MNFAAQLIFGPAPGPCTYFYPANPEMMKKSALITSPKVAHSNMRWNLLMPVILLTACTASQPTQKEPVMEVALPEVEVVGEDRPYRSSNPRTVDVVHTHLELSFDWQKSRVMGVAEIEAQPHFYEMSTATLDAKGMDI